MKHRVGVALCAFVLAGCGASPLAQQPEPPAAERLVSCGGPGFPEDLVSQPGNAETLDDPAAAALRRHLAEPGVETAWLPDAGWRVILQSDTEVTYLADAAPGSDPPYAVVSVAREGDGWRVAGWSQCRLQAGVAAGLGLASFRVDPGVELTAAHTEIPVLVTERACNSGQDAQGRIVEPEIVLGQDSVTVVFAVRPRGGNQDCPSNPETPHVLRLPEPLGERTLLDGSEIPPRDATGCAPMIGDCAP